MSPIDSFKKMMKHWNLDVTRIRRFPVQTPLGAQPGLGTQPRYETFGLFGLKIQNAVINIG